MRVARRFALPAEELAALGMAPAREVDRWIGPREGWVDRKGDACGDGRLLFHDAQFHGLRAFRPVRVGSRRALVSQLVALDTEGKAPPRDAGDRPDRDPPRPHAGRRGLCGRAVRGGAQEGVASGLRAVKVTELGDGLFTRRLGESSVGCVACHDGHGRGDFEDVDVGLRASLRSNRDAASLLAAEAATAPLFAMSR